MATDVMTLLRSLMVEDCMVMGPRSNTQDRLQRRLVGGFVPDHAYDQFNGPVSLDVKGRTNPKRPCGFFEEYGGAGQCRRFQHR